MSLLLQVYRDFEMQKVCYLPLTTLLLKPLHRVLHYQLLLEREFSFYSKGQLFQENRDQASKIHIKFSIFGSMK